MGFPLIIPFFPKSLSYLLYCSDCYCCKIHLFRRLLDEDASHLPHGHLAVVGVGVVVPLDGEKVGIIGKVDGTQESIALFTPQTGRDGYVTLRNKINKK